MKPALYLDEDDRVLLAAYCKVQKSTLTYIIHVKATVAGVTASLIYEDNSSVCSNTATW